jgi:hydrogenase expression/formation protein HypC
MCLGIPGHILELRASAAGGAPIAAVDFQGSQVEVSLSLVPQARPGDWVLVHAGFALTVLDPAEAAETWRWLEEAGLASEQGLENALPLDKGTA